MPFKFRRRLFWLVFWLALLPASAGQRVYTIMAVGDSITEGGASFSNWRYPLWEKLYRAGYLVNYVGSRKSDSRIGEIFHEGYGGKNSRFLAQTVPAHFKATPADIVLIHAGHNQFADQKPIPGILEDTASLVASFRAVNPAVTILLAQPIPSLKLPKYSYIPELHGALAQLAQRLDTPTSRVIIVPHGEGFDPALDTVADKVHPNASGAAKMVNHWFDALVQVLEPPPRAYAPEIIPYKKATKGDLTLHVFKPAPTSVSQPRPVIVFFFGGGWRVGTPLQFYPECAWFAERGFVAISADYRVATTHGTGPFEAVEDGKSAIRWIRSHAEMLGVDPDKIVAAGASAGGQVAAATGTLSAFEAADEKRTISSRPNAMALWYPVIDNGPSGYGSAEVKARYSDFSPLHNIGPQTPPTIIFLGTRDGIIPVSTARLFEEKMKDAGRVCQVRTYEGKGHPLYSYRSETGAFREAILREAEIFLSGQAIKGF